MNTIDNTLESISAAVEAYRKQPELLAKIDELNSTIANNETVIGNLRSTRDNLEDRLSNQAETIAALRKELDEARFRELLAQEDADNLRGKLSQIFGIATPPAPPVVETKPDPVQQEPESYVPEVPEGWVVPDQSPRPLEPSASAPSTNSNAGDGNAVSTDVTMPETEHDDKPYRNTSWYDAPYDMTYNEWLERGGREYMASNNGDCRRRRTD